jgi:hypothetical protein
MRQEDFTNAMWLIVRGFRCLARGSSQLLEAVVTGLKSNNPHARAILNGHTRGPAVAVRTDY